MNTQTYIICFIAGLAGVLFHVFAVKIPSVKEHARVANTTFSVGDYLKDDMWSIIAAALTVVILLVILDEVVAFKPEVLPFVKTAFVFVGFTGSSLLIALLGTASKKINSIVDLKTDIADNKVSTL